MIPEVKHMSGVSCGLYPIKLAKGGQQRRMQVSIVTSQASLESLETSLKSFRSSLKSSPKSLPS